MLTDDWLLEIYWNDHLPLLSASVVHIWLILYIFYVKQIPFLILDCLKVHKILEAIGWRQNHPLHTPIGEFEVERGRYTIKSESERQ